MKRSKNVQKLNLKEKGSDHIARSPSGGPPSGQGKLITEWTIRFIQAQAQAQAQAQIKSDIYNYELFVIFYMNG